jgi:serine protease Do
MEENPRIKRTLSNRMRAMIVALALFLAGGIGFGVERGIAQSPAQLPSPQDLSRTFISIAKQVKPAVVNIDVTEEVKRTSSSSMRQRGGSQLPFPFPFDDQEGPSKQRGTGSGVIISPDGYILTNNHVAGKATKMKVKLSDGRELTAKLVGADPETDLAVIKIDASNLPYAKLGNSDSLEQGEWVIALGSPFGLEQTMTAGIVSAIGRELTGTGQQFTKFIQTDASINPGNSGGPLINMNGEVVGINSMIYSRSGASEGIGFSIPSNLASKVYGQLVKNGKVQRAFLGVYPAQITPAIARNFNFKGTDGALVRDLSTDKGPAAQAGLRSGDIITEIDGKAIKSPSQLVEIVADMPVGKSVRIKYIRDGVEQTANVVLAERPQGGSETANPQEDEENGPEDGGGALGLGVTNLTPDAISQLKLKLRTGVVVTSVAPDGPAADAGITKGVVIHRINGKPITNRQDYLRELANLKGEKEVVLQVERSGVMDFVTVTLD